LDETPSIHRRIGHQKGEAIALGILGSLEYDESNDQVGMSLLERSAATAYKIGFANNGE
jgi:hypothetical protein